MSFPVPFPPVDEQLRDKLALFRPRDRNLIQRAALTEGGNAWIGRYLVLRFSDYAREQLGYTGPQFIGIGLLLRTARQQGAYQAVIDERLGGWNPFKDFYPPQGYEGFAPFERWYRGGGYADQGRRFRSRLARRNWWVHVRRQFVRWAKLLVRREALRRLGVDPERLPRKTPYVVTGELRSTALAGARTEAVSTTTRGAEARIIIPQSNPLPARAATIFRSLPPAEEQVVVERITEALLREIDQAVVRTGRGTLAKPRTVLLAPQLERLRALIAAAGPKPLRRSTPTAA